MLKNNKKGFTLLEVIVVIIILGVLAALALPRLFSNIEFSRSAEALNSISAVRQSVERCSAMRGNDYTGCDVFSGNVGATLDVTNPGVEAGAHFDYTVDITGGGTGDYSVVATRNALDGGTVTDTITLTVDQNLPATGGTITRAGTGAFGSIQ